MFKIFSYLTSSLYGKFVALKDPKIGPFEMTNCFDYTNLRPTQKIKSLGVISWGSSTLVRELCRTHGHHRSLQKRP